MPAVPPEPYDRLPLKRRVAVLKACGLDAFINDEVKDQPRVAVWYRKDGEKRSTDLTTFHLVKKRIERQHPALGGLTLVRFHAALASAVNGPRASKDQPKTATPATLQDRVEAAFRGYLEATRGIGRRIGRFAAVPQAYGLLPQSLNTTCLAVLTVLCAFRWRDTDLTFRVSHTTIAERAGIKRRATISALQRAIAAKVLEVVPNKDGTEPALGSRRRYRLVPPREWPPERHEELRGAIELEIKAAEEAQTARKRLGRQYGFGATRRGATTLRERRQQPVH